MNDSLLWNKKMQPKQKHSEFTKTITDAYQAVYAEQKKQNQ